MSERDNDIFGTILNVICFGFAALGAYAIASAYVEAEARRKLEPEYIITSRGKKIYLAGIARIEFPHEDAAQVHSAEPKPGDDSRVEEIHRARVAD